jgi:hypothetical protein
MADTLKIERGQVTYVYGEPGQPAEAEAQVTSLS